MTDKEVELIQSHTALVNFLFQLDRFIDQDVEPLVLVTENDNIGGLETSLIEKIRELKGKNE